jgi:hypothetical protein
MIETLVLGGVLIYLSRKVVQVRKPFRTLNINSTTPKAEEDTTGYKGWTTDKERQERELKRILKPGLDQDPEFIEKVRRTQESIRQYRAEMAKREAEEAIQDGLDRL